MHLQTFYYEVLFTTYTCHQIIQVKHKCFMLAEKIESDINDLHTVPVWPRPQCSDLEHNNFVGHFHKNCKDYQVFSKEHKVVTCTK